MERTWAVAYNSGKVYIINICDNVPEVAQTLSAADERFQKPGPSVHAIDYVVVSVIIKMISNDDGWLKIEI